MSDQQTQEYNEYMYEMEKANDERENRLASEVAKHEAEGKEPDEGFDNEETPPRFIPGNPMINYEPQDQLDRVDNRESYQFFRGY